MESTSWASAMDAPTKPANDENKVIETNITSSIDKLSISSKKKVVKKLLSDQDEPLLAENPDRFVLFPIKYDNIWEMYKKHEASFWTAEEIDLSQDTKDWSKIERSQKIANFVDTGTYHVFASWRCWETLRLAVSILFG